MKRKEQPKIVTCNVVALPHSRHRVRRIGIVVGFYPDGQVKNLAKEVAQDLGLKYSPRLAAIVTTKPGALGPRIQESVWWLYPGAKFTYLDY